MSVANKSNKKVTELCKMLESAKNIVLTGAPGTGKTYLARQIAMRMIDVNSEDELEKSGRFEFVQFHPSYDYTDFVEGLRPTQPGKDGNIGFKLEPGIFKKFCEEAKKTYIPWNTRSSTDEKLFDNAWERFVTEVKKAAVGGETYPMHYKISRVEDGVLSDEEDNQTKNLRMTDDGKVVSNKPTDGSLSKELCKMIYLEQWAGGWAEGASKFLRGLKDVDDFDEMWDKSVKGEVKHDIYMKELCKKMYREGVLSYDHVYFGYEIVRYLIDKYELEEYDAWKKYIFIIDEINRGEISKIFGELFFSIDPSYRGTDGAVTTQYSNMHNDPKEKFYIPENVYIIGTMNDIDRSVESFDFAMRRRFTWEEITAEQSAENMNLPQGTKDRMKKLNEAISAIDGLNTSYHIGAAYFLKLKNYNGDFGKLWQYHLEPLLKEYLRGMSDAPAKLKTLKEAYGD